MKFKELKQKLNEWMDSSFTVPGLNNPTIGDGSIGHFRVEDEQSRERVNAFLKLFGTQRYDCPKQAVSNLRAKMNLLGLDFSYDGKRKLNDHEIFTLTQFGGRTGMNDKGEFFSDDGISHRTGGKPLELHISIEHVPNSIQHTEMGSPEQTQMSEPISRYYVRPIMTFGTEQKTDLPPVKSGAASSISKDSVQSSYQPGMTS